MESKIYQLRDTRVLYQKEIFGEKNVKNSSTKILRTIHYIVKII